MDLLSLILVSIVSISFQQLHYCYFEFVGGWDPAWDKPRNIYLTRPLKGHATERNREERSQSSCLFCSKLPHID